MAAQPHALGIDAGDLGTCYADFVFHCFNSSETNTLTKAASPAFDRQQTSGFARLEKVWL
jgi:hypothetical protein